jgi:beta-lactamase class A
MLSGRGKRNRKRTRRLLPYIPGLPLIAIACLIVAGGLFVNELLAFSQQEDRLPQDITVAGLDVGGMSREEAQAELESIYAQPITLYYDDSPIILDPAEIGWRLNTQTMLAEAARVGEQEGSFWLRFFNHLTEQELQASARIPLVADYQRSLLENVLRDIAARYDRTNSSASYDVTNLMTYTGNSGTQIDLERALGVIDDALTSPTNRTTALPIDSTDTGRPDMDVLRQLIIDYLDSQGFIYDGQTTVASVFVLDLVTAEEISILGDVAFSAASTIKVPIMVDYFRRLDREPNQDEAFIMANSLLCSDNSSSNTLMEIIGGQDIYTGLSLVNETAQQIGLENTFITSPLPDLFEYPQPGTIASPETVSNPNYSTDPDPLNQTTVEDMGSLFTLLYDCANYGSGLASAFPDGEFNSRECRQMLELMSANDLQRLLQGGIPPEVRITHKNGWLNVSAMVGEAGIVYPPDGNPYVIAVYLWQETTPEEATSVGFNRLWPLLEGISRATWNYFSPEAALQQRRNNLPNFAEDCEEHGYLPPYGQVNLEDINGWRR